MEIEFWVKITAVHGLIYWEFCIERQGEATGNILVSQFAQESAQAEVSSVPLLRLGMYEGSPLFWHEMKLIFQKKKKKEIKMTKIAQRNKELKIDICNW